MGNEYDGFSALLETLKDFEEAYRLLGRKHRSRLVQNDRLGTAHQGLDDLDTLCLTYGNLADLLVELHIHVVFFNIFSDILSGLLKINL